MLSVMLVNRWPSWEVGVAETERSSVLSKDCVATDLLVDMVVHR